MSDDYDPKLPPDKYVVGVDLGQSRDPTAICIVRKRPLWDRFEVGYINRMPLGTSYPGVVAHVGRILGRLPRGTELVIDATGVGKPVFEMFVGNGISPIGVMITAGTSETVDGRMHGVPKLTLISRVQALLHEGRLKIQKDLPEAGVLVRELQDFRVEYSPSGHLTFNARSGKHDDLVLALAIAVWRAHRDRRLSFGTLGMDFGRNSGSGELRQAMNGTYRYGE
jgi:hypothetical protein